MKLIIDIPEQWRDDMVWENFDKVDELCQAILDGDIIPDNATNGKEILIKYCLEHSGEEIYDLLKQVSDASMSWTDSRGFIIEWLERGGMA